MGDDHSGIHLFNTLMSSGALISCVLLLVWVGEMKTKVNTMWRWWENHTQRGTRIRMKEDGEG